MDLTFGEVGKIVQLSLINVDPTTNPPVQTPLDLTTATKVELIYNLLASKENPKTNPTTKQMNIVFPSGGIVQYKFVSTDLDKPPEIGKTGKMVFTVKVTFNDGRILYSNTNGEFTAKDDSIL